MPAVGLTDVGNMFGVMQFGSAVMKAGVQPVIGTLMPVTFAETDKSPFENRNKHKPERPALVPLLVQNEVGHQNLMAILSRAYQDADTPSAMAASMEDLAAHHEGLIAFSGNCEGPIGALMLQGQHDAAEKLTRLMLDVFGDRFYMELMRHDLDEEDRLEPAFLDQAFRLGIPLVATNDALFIDPGMHEAHDALICIAQSAHVDERDRDRRTRDHYFKPAAEMIALFEDLPEAVDNTLQVARRCAYAAPARPPILPSFDTSEGRNEADELRAQAREGLEARLAQCVVRSDMGEVEREDATRPYRERLEYELDIIVQMKFPGYFLIVADFIKWAKENNIPVGPGRGSGAGSVVAWSLLITDLDPLRFGLLFERFLNPERVSMPDFDIDFCMNRRDRVIRYVQERYGADKVASIITFGKLQARAVLRDVGRVLGLPFPVVDRISKLVPFNPANPPTLAQALTMEPRLKQERDADPKVARMIDIAMKLEGLPRHASTHAAGVVIGDRPLEQLIPLYRDPRSIMPVTQFNMKDVEKAGLVKFDFLGLTTLTMLRLAVDLIADEGITLDLSALELDDEPAYEIMANADTTGVFQLESGGMRDALRKLKPDCFEDVIAMVSLYRPGPMDNIPRYIAVKHGDEDPSYMHPMLEPILQETNGVIIYQEQVMEIAKQLAGYTLGGADLLRRAMGKKIKEEMDAQREIFKKGAVERGIEEDLADAIFDGVAKFASYGFNKSHAAAYALLAYHTAYIKANHPVQFYASVMTMEMANQEKLAVYRQEMMAKGIPLLPPDINQSRVLFAVDKSEGKPGVRFALSAIKGVGAGAMEFLVEEREKSGPYKDLFDLTARLGPRVLNKRILEGLIKAGAGDCFTSTGTVTNRRQLFESIEIALRHGAVAIDESQSGQATLFAASADMRPPSPRMLSTPDWPVLERLRFEFQTVGTYMSAHPLDEYASVLKKLGVIPIAGLRRHIESRTAPTARLAGVIVAKQERTTEKTRLAFIMLSDASAQIEVTFFSEALNANRELLECKEPVLIDVDARLDEGEVKVSAISARKLDDARPGDTQMHEICLSDFDVVDRLLPMLAKSERFGSRIRLVVPTVQREELVVDLSEDFVLRPANLGDIKAMDGVISVTELDQQSIL